MITLKLIHSIPPTLDLTSNKSLKWIETHSLQPKPHKVSSNRSYRRKGWMRLVGLACPFQMLGSKRLMTTQTMLTGIATLIWTRATPENLKLTLKKCTRQMSKTKHHSLTTALEPNQFNLLNATMTKDAKLASLFLKERLKAKLMKTRAFLLIRH